MRRIILILALTVTSLVARDSELLSPIAGSTLTSSEVTFEWSPGSGRYLLDVGSTPGGTEFLNSGFIPNDTLSRTVADLPTDTEVYVRLWCETGEGTNRYQTQTTAFNTDLDRDGIKNPLDLNPSIADPETTIIDGDETWTILGSGRVASLESTELFAATFDDMTTTEARTISTKIYNQFRDDFDFIFVSSNQPSTPSGVYFGRFYNAQNDIEGIGKNIFDLSDRFGSDGKLQGFMHLTSLRGLRSGPSLHELCHNWGNSMDSVPTEIRGHWGRANIGGQLGGWKPNTLESLGANEYRAANPRTGTIGSWGGNANGGNGLPYSQFELYVMGLISANDVGQDIKIANDFQWIDTAAGTFSASSITTRTMAEVVAIDGPRLPDASSSQKTFRVLHLILTDTPLTTNQWADADEDVFNFSLAGDEGTSSYNFWEATEGQASLSMDELEMALINAPSEVIPPTILSINFLIDRFEIEMVTEPDQTYTLQHSSTILPGSWQTSETMDGSGAIITLSFPHDEDLDRNFFRVATSPR